MQLLGNLFEYELARRGEQLNILGATSGDTGSAAEYAMRGKQGVRVFMLSPHGRMSAFQQAQMFSLQDENIHNIAVERRVRRLPGHRQGRLQRPRLQGAYKIGTVNSINWARLLAQVVYYFKATFAARGQRPEGQLHRAVGQLRQRLRRPHGPHDGPAHRPSWWWPPTRTTCSTSSSAPASTACAAAPTPRNLQPVDGHLQGLQLRALRVRPGRPRRTADGLKVGLEQRRAGVPLICLETALPAKFDSAIREALGRDPERPHGLENIESLPRRYEVLDADVGQIRDYVSAHAND
jgi:threonine synthase